MSGRLGSWWLGPSLALLAVIVALGAAFLVRGEFASGSSTATIRIEDGSAPPGGKDTVRLEALNVPSPGIEDVRIDVKYDDAVIDCTDCEFPPGFPFDLGYCNEDYEPDKAIIAAWSADGVSGDIPLVDITCYAVGQPGECSPLAVQVVQLDDPQGRVIPRTEQDGQFCIVDSLSPTPTSSPTPTATRTPTPTPTATPGATPTPAGSTRTLQWTAGWQNATWSGASTPEEVFACAAGKYAAAYRFTDAGLERYFPDRPDISNMNSLAQYDAFLILVTQPVTCTMPVAASPGASRTLQWGAGWQNAGWSGADGTAPEDAFACADGSYAAAYRFTDAGLERYFPNRPDISNMGSLNKYDAFLILLTAPVSCAMPIAS